MLRKILIAVLILVGITLIALNYLRFGYKLDKNIVEGVVIQSEVQKSICFDGCVFPVLVRVRLNDGSQVAVKGIKQSVINYSGESRVENPEGAQIEGIKGAIPLGASVKIKGAYDRQKREVNLTSKNDYLKIISCCENVL